jgi:leucyl-tRNA synthetase
MDVEGVAEHGEAARTFAGELAANPESLRPALPVDREREVLRRAAWLLEKEFGAEIEVLAAEEAPPDLREKAAPGRPGIEIE